MSSKNCIKVYARLKPEKKKKNLLNYSVYKATGIPGIVFELPEGGSDSRCGHKFRFHEILDENIEQAKVFETVVQPVIDNVLDGYNGTILAYGQTGSGKTFTMTGSTEEYETRGVIPRSIQYIFEIIRKSPNTLYSVYISYLEIYNEFGYDLLDQKSNATKLDDLQKVTALEDNSGNMHLRNLSVLPVTAETEALRFLFLGDTNRTIAETPMNPFSTRSHCIFTVHIGIRKPNSQTVRRGKLHLVDLAGSERLAKSSPTEMKTINEAKHINLSLHYLEQVIVALSESKRQHIPYRNSLLTSVLRDSLGGNCLTSMIATLSLKSNNFLETISTCRFAERVALINNELKINEESDPQLEVAALRSEVESLKRQVAVYTKTDITKKLTETQEQKCKEAVQKYIQGLTTDLDIEANLQFYKFCFQLMKNMILASNLQRKMVSDKNKKENGREMSPVTNVETLEDWQQLIKQRDSEISILINLLRKEKEKNNMLQSANNIKEPNIILSATNAMNPTLWCTSPNSRGDSSMSSPRSSVDLQYQQLHEKEKAAYKLFINDSENGRDLIHYRGVLKDKLATARKLAGDIELVKSKIITIQKELQSVADSPNSLKMMVHLKQRLTEQRSLYKTKIEILRKLKSETDHLKSELETARIQHFQRFKEWYKVETLQKIPCRETSSDLHKSSDQYKSLDHFKGPGEYSSDQYTSPKHPTSPKCPKSPKNEVQSIFSKDSSILNIEDHLGHSPALTHSTQLFTEPALGNKMFVWDEYVKTEPIYNQPNEDETTCSFVYDDGETSGEQGRVAEQTESKIHPNILEKSDTVIDVHSDILSTATISDHDEIVEGNRNSDFEVIYKNPNMEKTNKNWEEFVKSLPLTGDSEVDAEIIHFYKGSFGIK